MRICMVFYDMQEFGGLEEYAATLAIGLQQQGHQVSALSAAWAPPENQYVRRLREHHVPFVQAPKWLSYPASDWTTKEKLLAKTLWILSPVIFVLSILLCLLRRQSWRQAWTSAHGWLRGQLTKWIIGPDRRPSLTRLLLRWWQFRWRPDLLHIHGYTTNLLFAIEWAAMRGLPVVYEEHQTPDPQFGWWQGFQQSVNKASVVVAVSQKSADALRTVCGVTRPIIVRNSLLPDPMAGGWRRESKPATTCAPINVTTVARLYVTKGLVYLLEAIPQVKAKHPNAEFRVYGEGPLRQELLSYARKLGLDGNAIFVGAFTKREELARIMAQTDIFALPSVLEGQPLVVVEAMAYECPIVATKVGGVPELIENGVNGLLCPPKEPGQLAQSLCELMDDPALRMRLGQAARLSYERSPFQPAAVCAHFVSIYQQALQQTWIK